MTLYPRVYRNGYEVNLTYEMLINRICRVLHDYIDINNDNDNNTDDLRVGCKCRYLMTVE